MSRLPGALLIRTYSRAGVMDTIGAERVYLEVDGAVAAFRASSPVGASVDEAVP